MLWVALYMLEFVLGLMLHIGKSCQQIYGKSKQKHCDAVKWILRYLNGTTDHGILFTGANNSTYKVLGYVDSDFVAYLDKRRFITRFVPTIYDVPVIWKTSLQSVVGLSTTEMKYIIFTEVVKETTWLKDLVSELGLKQESISINCYSFIQYN